MTVQLGQNSAHVQVSISLRSRRLVSFLDIQRLLEVNQSLSQLINLAVVAGQIIVGHSHTVLIIFRQLLASAQKLKCFLVFAFSDIIDCEKRSPICRDFSCIKSFLKTVELRAIGMLKKNSPPVTVRNLSTNQTIPF